MAQENFFSSGSAVGVDFVDVKQVDSKPAATGFESGNIIYDRTEGKFYKTDGTSWSAVTTLDSGLITINGLSDVDTSTSSPSTGDVLEWDGSNWVPQARLQSFVIACSDETTDLQTGTGKATYRMPYAFTVSAVRASVTTAPVGSTLVVDINEGGTSILSTKLSIDAGEKTSTTAATPAVISDTALADDAEITIDIDQVGSSTAGAGLKVSIIGRPA